MPKPSFQLAGDERKHYARTHLWLPCCKRQLARLRGGRNKSKRPLRYLTFCGEEAIDVLLLEEQGIITVRDGSYADVAFAALTDEYVAETLRTIPDASGFSGDFFETVLFDPKNQPDLPILRSGDSEDAFFAELQDTSDTLAGRKALNIAALREQLAAEFPFDIINLDLCGYTFREKEDIPGRTIRALRRILGLQRKRRTYDGSDYEVDEFGFLYTTRIDVNERLGKEYERLLDAGIDSNISVYPDVRAALVSRLHAKDAAVLRRKDRQEYLRLAIPKQLVITLASEGWEIDPIYGVECLAIQRSKDGHRYSMLHMAMTLRRKHADTDSSANKISRKSGSAYHQTVRQLFGSSIPSVPKHLPKEVSASLKGLLAKSARQRTRSS